MNKAGIWTIIVVIVLVAIGAFIYINSKNIAVTETVPTNEVSSLPVETGTTTDMTIASSTNAVKEFIVSGESFSFTPNTISVKKGDTVKITFKNVEGFHDFKIDEFNVATARIGGGKEETVTFVADKAGQFQYYCSVGSHRANGMWGTITVSE